LRKIRKNGRIRMARITVEDCLKRVESRFQLVILAARRAKMIMKGAKPLIEADNRPIVMALREVAAGKVRVNHPEDKGKGSEPSDNDT
jgi:DNA-directed RNA polymerase subunit omega